jgi:hypothetical protein
MVSFLQMSAPNPRMQFPSTPHVPQTPSVSSCIIWTPDYNCRREILSLRFSAISSILLPLPHYTFPEQLLSMFLPEMWEIKFQKRSEKKKWWSYRSLTFNLYVHTSQAVSEKILGRVVSINSMKFFLLLIPSCMLFSQIRRWVKWKP